MIQSIPLRGNLSVEDVGTNRETRLDKTFQQTKTYMTNYGYCIVPLPVSAGRIIPGRGIYDR